MIKSEWVSIAAPQRTIAKNLVELFGMCPKLLGDYGSAGYFVAEQGYPRGAVERLKASAPDEMARVAFDLAYYTRESALYDLAIDIQRKPVDHPDYEGLTPEMVRAWDYWSAVFIHAANSSSVEDAGAGDPRFVMARGLDHVYPESI